MKKVLLIVLIFLLFFLFFSNKTIYKLNGKYYLLYTAKNQEQWQKGLMFYKSKKDLKGTQGMIFIFPDKESRSFWNENTYLDLEVYWINDDRVVGKSYLPAITKSKEIITISSPEKVNKVVELTFQSFNSGESAFFN